MKDTARNLEDAIGMQAMVVSVAIYALNEGEAKFKAEPTNESRERLETSIREVRKFKNETIDLRNRCETAGSFKGYAAADRLISCLDLVLGVAYDIIERVQVNA